MLWNKQIQHHIIENGTKRKHKEMSAYVFDREDKTMKNKQTQSHLTITIQYSCMQLNVCFEENYIICFRDTLNTLKMDLGGYIKLNIM